MPAESSSPHNDPPNLLIARPGEAQLRGNRSDPPVRLSDRRRRLVETLGRCDEARVDPRSKLVTPQACLFPTDESHTQ